ncbi:MAG TPA: hypothetical protein VI685_20440, partial [Candidatus Angelobacter sp.]
LLDKLKELREVEDKRQERVFEKLIEPVYMELQLVHEDYMGSMRELQRMIPVESDDEEENIRKRKEAVQYLNDRRAKLSPVRIKLGTYHGALLNNERELHRDSYRFVSAVLAYLYENVEGFEGTTRYHVFISHLSEASSPNYRNKARASMRLLTAMIGACEERWKEASTVFTSIQVKTLSR